MKYCADCHLALTPKNRHRRCWHCYRERELQRKFAAALGPVLKDLLRLCHPDVHPPERQWLAHEVTVQLNKLKEAHSG
jgi:hypothetical protein